MSELKLPRPDKSNFNYLFTVIFFMASLHDCHAADLENCKSDCVYYKTECIKEANKASQRELQRFLLETNPDNILAARVEQKRAKEDRRIERLNMCDNNYSSCIIQCSNPAFK